MAKPKNRQPILDIELRDFNAYRRITEEHNDVTVLLAAIEVWKDKYDSIGSSKLKFVQTEADRMKGEMTADLLNAYVSTLEAELEKAQNTLQSKALQISKSLAETY